MPIYGHNRLIKHPRSTIAHKGVDDKTRTYNAWYFGNPCCCREYTFDMYAYCKEIMTISDPPRLQWEVDFCFECYGKWWDYKLKKWKDGYKNIKSSELPTVDRIFYSGMGIYEELHKFTQGAGTNEIRTYRIVWASADRLQPPKDKAEKIVDCEKNIDITDRINHYYSHGICPFWVRPPSMMDCTKSWDGWFELHPPTPHTVQRPVTIFNLEELDIHDTYRCEWIDGFGWQGICSSGIYPDEKHFWLVKKDGNNPRWLYDAYANPVGYKPIDLWKIFGIDAQERCSVQKSKTI